MKQSEASTQALLRLAAATNGQALWRNNSGACRDDTGRLIRYGLANDSKKINDVFKSSDLIGITTIEVTPEMIGQEIGVFTAIEVKSPDWTFRESDDRAVAQKAFIDDVVRRGGLAGFVNDTEQYYSVLRDYGVMK